MKQKTCFVIIGYGVKTDYTTGREINLDKTYHNIIEPVFKELDFLCFRASDIKHSGVIDVPMYESILKADFVLADITTLNPNVLYELGIRHAVKKNTTIIISDKELKYPFDLSHILIDQYEHLGKAIDYDEVLRFKAHLKEKVSFLLDNPKTDSPLYTVVQNLNTPTFTEAEIEEIVKSKEDENSLSEILENAEDAKNAMDYKTAIQLLEKAINISPDNAFIIQRLALVTYKSKLPNPIDALFRAELILDELNPNLTTDIETLGLSGAINKRLYEQLDEISFLDKSLNFYERGYYIAQDYYNGINASFLMTIRSTIDDNKFEAYANYGKANLIRRKLIEICNKIMQDKIWEERDDQQWVFLTLAECYAALGLIEDEEKIIKQAKSFLKGNFGLDTYNEQRSKLVTAIEIFKNKYQE